MKNRASTALLCAFLSILILTLMSFSLTYGKFSQESPVTGGEYENEIEYIVSDRIEVQDMGEFIGAIENGYSNIIVTGDMEDEIVITAGVTDVGTDLIIDLRGHKIIRNNRDPLLNVENGVRLTIIDTSESKTGGFYNPVGSVLQISGGTLTVSGGEFESGPRKSEYRDAARESVTAEVYQKTDSGYTFSGWVSMPVLSSGETGEYFESGLTGNDFVVADTYLYYTNEEKDYKPIVAVQSGSADFYYRYAEDDGSEAVIYGYNRVKELAGSEETAYAAVSMQSGNMYVRGGKYQSYFGVDTAYGIYADGGYMAVESGDFSVIEDGTCIRCNYDVVSDSEYLRVAGGAFRSEWGDTIRVNGGKMAVTGGDFGKDASRVPSDAQKGSAVIRVENGVLDGSGAVAGSLCFSVTGSDLYGIYADGNDIEVDIARAQFLFNDGTTAGENNTGIYAAGGSIRVSDSVFSIPDRLGYGIRAERSAAAGQMTDLNILGCVFQMTGAESTGISIREGSIVLDGTEQNPYTLFYIDGVRNSYGVLAGARKGEAAALSDAGAISVRVNSAQFFLGQTGKENEDNAFNGAGVYANAENSEILIGNGLFITGGSGCSGIYAEKGTVAQSEADSKLVIVTGAVYNGYAAGGWVGSDWIRFPQALSAYRAGAQLDVSASGASESYGIYTAEGTIDLISAYIAVYGSSASGVITAQGGNVSAEVLDVDIRTKANAGSEQLTTTAVSTQNGSVSLGEATINTDSLGITAQGGNVTVRTALTLNSERGTAVYVNGGDLSFGENSVVKIESVIDGNCAWGTTDRPYSYDGVYVHGGSLIAAGSFNVTHTGIENDRGQYTGNNGDTLFREYQIRSFAVRVESSSSASSTVSIRSGDIRNSVGGGIYVSAGGAYTVNVSLGDEASGSGPSITTSGSALHEDVYDAGRLGMQDNIPNIPISGAASNWAYCLSRTGGHAAEVNGGALTVYGGTYSAAQGDGILVKSGTANIYGGSFSGNDVYLSDGGTVAGPAASYAFKMYGGEANVYAGTFGSRNGSGSGAFIMGNSASDMGRANIYGGTFTVGGQSGFSVYDYADLLFAPHGGENGRGGDITVSGLACAIAVENRTAVAEIKIRGGSFSSTGSGGGYDGIWYSNPNAGLVISGGTFRGSAKHGLNFATWPRAGVVSISGGTFIGYGSNVAIGGNFSETAILAANCYFEKITNSQSNSQWTVRQR